MPRTPPPDGQVTLSDAMRHLHERGLDVSEGMIYKWIAAGRLKRYGPETRKQKYYLLRELDQIIAEELKGQRRPKNLPVLIDWALAADVPAALKLSMQLYPAEEVDLREAAIYQAWRKNNSYLTMAAFNLDRSECYATIQVVPLAEQIILDVLSGKRDDNSIEPDEIPAYDTPGAYNLLVASATCLKTQPALLYQVLRKYIDFWIEQYPERWIKRVYAQAATDEGMRIVQHFFMAPRLDLAHNAFMLDLQYPPAARMIKEFKKSLAEKAPLPTDLQWPPLPAAHQEPTRVQEPLHRFVVDREIADSAKPAPREKLAPAGSELPEGLISLSEYAAQHNLALSTLKHAEAAGHIPAFTRGRWKQGRNIIQIALDAECKKAIEARYGKPE